MRLHNRAGDKLVALPILVLLVVVAALFSPIQTTAQTASQATTATTLIFTRPLYVGQRGADVSALQQFLKAQGYFTYPTITGFFGSFTWGAVAAFQWENGIEAIGIVGPKTRAKILALTMPNTILSSSPTSLPPNATIATSTPALVPSSQIEPWQIQGLLSGGNSDSTGPGISSISSGTPDTTSAIITWTTDEDADSQVDYGITSSYGSSTSLDSTRTTSHSVALTGLSSYTTYHYRVRSTDASGNLTVSSEQTFTTVAETGQITGVTINSSAWTADVAIKGLSTGGTYALTPDSTPKLTFTVTSAGYDSSGNATTISRTVYGTVPLRQAYPNGTTNTESSSGGILTTTVALSDDILPDDTVTISSLAGWYTQGTANLSASSITPTNNSTASDYRPIGAWITPTNIPRAAGEDMTVEFFVASRYPRNNGQVASVVFTADDGAGNTVTQSTSTMSQSTFLFRTTCTATSGSAVLASCGNTRGLFAGQHVTVSTGSASAVGIGEPKIVSIDSSSQITMNTNATANGTVTLTLGNPVYVYAATFTGAQLDALNEGVASVRAVAYPNVGTTTLDTAAGADGVAIAASTVTPNLKNLQFYNDKSSNYSGVWAWVGSAAGASPAVQTSATDPGGDAYYGSIKAATDAIKTYMNANKGHNNACGGYVYLKTGTTTGSGGTVSSNVPTNCAANLIIDCDPAVSVGSCVFLAGTSANRDLGYTTLIKNLKITDDATNKIVLDGPDGATTNPRQAHVIFQNDWIVESQSSASAFFNEIGWRQYYNSFIDQSVDDGRITKTFGVTGITSDQFGNTELGAGGLGVMLYNSLGNVYSNLQVAGVGNSSSNYIQTTSAVLAFDKVLNISAAPPLSSTNDGTTHNNWALVQSVFEMTGTTNTQPAFTFGADDDTANLSNWLRQYTTVVGNRSNEMYESVGTSAITKTGAKLYNLDYLKNTKGDYFPTESGNRTGSWRFRFGVSHIGNVSGPSNSGTSPNNNSWLGDFFGLTGNTSTAGYNQTSYTFQDANQNSSAGGDNTGFGWYKPNTTTGLTNRVPAGFAGFPSDIEGTPRKNDGTGCAGAYEC